jgi:hypothetical protein
MRAAMAAMHGFCRRRRRELTVIGISTPTATPLTPAEVRQAGWGPRGPPDPPRRPRARPRAARSNRQASRPSQGAQDRLRPRALRLLLARRGHLGALHHHRVLRLAPRRAAGAALARGRFQPGGAPRGRVLRLGLSRPTSGRARTVPMVDHPLMKLAGRERPHAAGGSCLPSAPRGLHGLVGAAPRLRSGAEARRPARAAPPDLCHSFGSLAINYGSIVPV